RGQQAFLGLPRAEQEFGHRDAERLSGLGVALQIGHDTLALVEAFVPEFDPGERLFERARVGELHYLVRTGHQVVEEPGDVVLTGGRRCGFADPGRARLITAGAHYDLGGWSAESWFASQLPWLCRRPISASMAMNWALNMSRRISSRRSTSLCRRSIAPFR